MSSSIQNTASKEQSTGWFQSFVEKYFVPPAAAGTAIVFTFYGFVAKSAKQKEEPVPKMSFREIVQGGIYNVPNIGAIVGTQLIVQDFVKKWFAERSGKKEGEPLSFGQEMASSILVGGVSTPFLAIFNGKTQGLSASESLKRLKKDPKQGVAIITRETSFLFSFGISDRLENLMQRFFGKKKSVEYGAAFASGFIGSLIGHAPDTALTRWQADLKIDKLSQLYLGPLPRAFTLGCFTVFYKGAKEFYNSLIKKASGN